MDRRDRRVVAGDLAGPVPRIATNTLVLIGSGPGPKSVATETEVGHIRGSPELRVFLVKVEGTLVEVPESIRQGPVDTGVCPGRRGPGPKVGVTLQTLTLGGPKGRGRG